MKTQATSRRFLILFLLTTVWVPHSSFSQTPACHSAGFDAIALPPPPLMEGIGTSAMPITTSSPLAQKYFDQGLRLLHCFWDFEAYRAFKEAARLDSACTMAYWGIAAALQQNSSEMNDEKNKALEKAITFSATAGEREQAYIRAAALMRDKGRAAYINEMEALLDHHPNDIEAQLFLARFLSAAPSTYAPDGRPREGKVYGQMILQNLLKTHPDHAAVHHYWIHAVENGPHPERALASAVKLPQLAPRSGHLMHMPGHIYYRIGEYGKAREAFLAALRVDEDYMQAQNIAPVNNWNYTHNLDYLVGNCAEDGRYAEGLKWAAVLQDIDLQQERLKASGLSYIIYGGYTATARLQIRYSFWNEATKSLRQSLDGHELKSSLARGYLNGLLHFAQGMEALEKNKPAVTETHLQALDDLIQRLAGEKVQWGSDWYSGYGKKKLEVSALELRGALLNLQGRQAEAIQLLQEGAQKEKELGYWEPPHYSRPVLESLAQIYLQAKKWEEAREAYRQILRLRPKSGHALLGLARAFWGEGKKDQAAPAYAEFLQTWTQADAPLPQVKEAKTRLANGAR